MFLYPGLTGLRRLGRLGKLLLDIWIPAFAGKPEHTLLRLLAIAPFDAVFRRARAADGRLADLDL